MKVICGNCGTIHNVNPEKHRTRPKWCVRCRSVIVEEDRKYTARMIVNKIIVEVEELKLMVKLATMRGAGWLAFLLNGQLKRAQEKLEEARAVEKRTN